MNPVVPWLGPEGLVLGYEEGFLEFINQTPTSVQLEEGGFVWEYSNVGYGLAAKIVEKASGMSYSTFLRQRILEPLAMQRTAVSKSDIAEDNNIAFPYAQHEDQSFSKLNCHWTDEDRTSILASLGLRSSVRDLLVWCKATMSAEQNNDFTTDCKPLSKEPKNPLKQMATIRSVAVDFREEHENSGEYGYCLGWFKTTMPSNMSSWGSYNLLTSAEAETDRLNKEDILGTESPPRTLIKHTGLENGAAVSVNTFPESNSAVVVLSNGLNVGDASDFTAQILIQALFDLKPYVDIMPRVKIEGDRRRQQYSRLLQDWEANRDTQEQEDKKSNWDYLGDYVALAMTLSVCQTDDGDLSLVFGDYNHKPFKLRYYNRDQYSFFPCTRDEWSSGGWLDWDYYKIGVFDFRRNNQGEVNGLWWTWERLSNPIWFSKGKKSV